MSPFSVTSRRLPGISGFLKQSPMFREVGHQENPTQPDLINAAISAVRRGRYRPGDRFPNPGEITELTGASLVDSLGAVSSLLKSHVIYQTPSGSLFIAPTR
jgi:hypothetical protein